jgi:hypothetical protein
LSESAAPRAITPTITTQHTILVVAREEARHEIAFTIEAVEQLSDAP